MKPYRVLSIISSRSIAAILLAAVLMACNGEAPPPRAPEGSDTVRVGGGSRVTIDSAAGTTVPTAKDPMQGMDHSKMTGPPAASPTAPASGTMPGMDHSKMGRSSAGTDVASMDHARMAGAARPNAPRPSMGDMPGMAHGAETRTPQNVAADDAATLKLRQLIARLVADSVVRTRILADSFLRNRWQDSMVRRMLRPPP